MGEEFANMICGHILGLWRPFHMPSYVQGVGNKLSRCGQGSSSPTWERQDLFLYSSRRVVFLQGIHSPTFPCSPDGGGFTDLT